MQITTKDEYQIMTEHLQPLLCLVDRNIQSLEYVNINQKDLIKLNYENKARYIDVSNLDPFKVLNTVVSTMDDYNLHYLFLTDQQVYDIYGITEEDLEME